MKTYKDIEDITKGLNEKAIKDYFFIGSATEIDNKANKFVADFSVENDLESHTISPSRWWFESKTHGIFDDGNVELFPLVNHSVQKLHPNNKHKETKFVAVNVEKAKLTKHFSKTISDLRKENEHLRKENNLLNSATKNITKK